MSSNTKRKVEELESIHELPKKQASRVVGFYMYDGKHVYWNGKTVQCQHQRQRNQCKDCAGAGIG